MKKIIITTGVIAVVGGVVTALTMSSCDQCEPEDKPSVIVHLVDQDAAQGAVAHVTADELWYDYTNEDGETVREQATCLNPDEGCTDWQLGHGQPGDYAFNAKVCGQEFGSSVALEYNDDGCVVDTRIVDLPVTTTDCPEVAAPEAPSDPGPQAPAPTLDIKPWPAPEGENCTLEGRFSVVASAFYQDGSGLVPLALDRPYFVHNPTEEHKGKGHEIGQGKGHEIGKGKGHDGELVGDFESGICLDKQCTRFAAGVEREGTFLVGGYACGQMVEATVEVGKTADGCHVQTESVTLVFDQSTCPKPPAVPGTPGHTPTYDAKDPIKQVDLQACPGGARIPSAYLMPVVQEGDMLMAWPTAGLTYAHRQGEDPETQTEAYCAVPTEDGRCKLYVTGYGLTGDFRAYTTACETESSISYSVGRDEDMCVKTEWVYLSVDTNGCVRVPSPEGNPPPGTVAGGTAVTN